MFLFLYKISISLTYPVIISYKKIGMYHFMLKHTQNIIAEIFQLNKPLLEFSHWLYFHSYSKQEKQYKVNIVIIIKVNIVKIMWQNMKNNQKFDTKMTVTTPEYYYTMYCNHNLYIQHQPAMSQLSLFLAET